MTFRKLMWSAALAVALTFGLSLAPAFAAQGGEGNNTGCNGVGNTNSPCVGQGGQGGEGGKGGDGGQGGKGGNATSTSTSNAKAKAKANATGVGVGIGTGGNAASTQTVTGGNINIDEPRQAPPAFAPGLVAAPETCMGAVAVGASSPFGGISFGTTYKSNDCELRMYARSLMALATTDVRYAHAAASLLSQNPNVARALKAVGLTVPGMVTDPTQTETRILSAPDASTPSVVGSTGPSRDESQVMCPDTNHPKIRAGNGEYFCR